MALIHISDEKRAANAANAKHSTGPKSAEGKSRARQNAAKHGLRSRLFVIETLGETAEENLALKNLYLDRVQPRNPEELFLAEALFKQHLNLRRLGRYEAGAAELLAQDAAKQAEPQSETEPNQATLWGGTFLAAAKAGNPLDTANRMEERVLRMYARTQEQLNVLRRRNIFNEEQYQWPDQAEALREAAAQLEADEKRPAERNEEPAPAPEPEKQTIEPTTPVESTPAPVIPIDTRAKPEPPATAIHPSTPPHKPKEDPKTPTR